MILKFSVNTVLHGSFCRIFGGIILNNYHKLI
jgi:hypothetical protein